MTGQSFSVGFPLRNFLDAALDAISEELGNRPLLRRHPTMSAFGGILLQKSLNRQGKDDSVVPMRIGEVGR